MERSIPEGRQLYQYEPLRTDEEVRLLVLAAGASSGEIRCDLKHYSLSSIPRFEAVSYAWGDISKSHEVLCDNDHILVTKSAFIALQYLRHRDRERFIWIDAICINQGSDVEKIHQVGLMREIYTQAWQTLVWLGDDIDNNAELAFDYISQLDECLDSEYLDDEYRSEPELRKRITTRYQIREGMFEDWALGFINAIAPVFDQSWFRRLWVVQEVALSNSARLIFGNHSMSMAKFMAVMNFMSAFHELNLHQQRFAFHSMGNLISIDIVQDMIQQERDGLPGNQPFNILELLRYTEKFVHTDPRDRIYALLGLTETPGLLIDYALTTETTFRRFGVWALDAFPNLALLSYARGVAQSKWDMPSWVPSADMDGLPYSLLNVDHYQASGMTLINGGESAGGLDNLWTLNQNRELCLKGIFVDRISEIGWGALNAATPKDLKYALLEAEGIAKCRSRNLEDSRYKRFCAAMTLETAADNTKASSQQAEWFHEYLLAIKSQTEQSGEIHHSRHIVQFLLRHWARYRWFCRTRRDRFAFVPWRSWPGDGIWIIRGARIPYALRRQPDGKFKLVGECWIQAALS
jgi:hypothetical protein